MWSHKFFCLSDKNCQIAPQTRRQKEALEACGLGEKVISTEMHSSAEELHRLIMNTYPKLANCGGYELLRCYGNSRTLSLIEPPYTAAHLSTSVAQSRIYIRPLQSSVRLNVEDSSTNGVSLLVWNFRYLLDCEELNSFGAITVNSIAGLSDTVCACMNGAVCVCVCVCV